MDMPNPLDRPAGEFEERLQPQIKEATRTLTELSDQVTTYIRANPGKCLLGAVAAGYVIGRIVRRK